MTRLRKIVTTPYLKGAVALIGQHSADGYGGVDIIDSAASEASAEYAGGAGVTLTTFIGALIAQLTYADKVSIIPDLIERGFCVSQHVNQDGDPRYPPLGVIPGHYANMCPMSLAFQYQWSDLDKRHQEEHGPLGSGAWGPAHSPPPPRFAVGTAVECKLGSEEDWVPGEVIRIGWPEAFGDMGPAVPADGCDFICPYQIKLDSGRLVFSPADTDASIRLKMPNPQLVEVGHDVVGRLREAGVSDDNLLAAALEVADKLSEAMRTKRTTWAECL